MHPTIQSIAQALESWAAPASAQSYDNVGLQVGDPSRKVSTGLIALDLTPAVLVEASGLGAELVITHHPLIFRPLRSITPRSFVSGLALQLAEKQVALYSIHTNLDAAPEGVSFALAQTLGLTKVRILNPLSDSEALLKVEVSTALDATWATDLRAALPMVRSVRAITQADASASGGRILELVVPRWDVRTAIRYLTYAFGVAEAAIEVTHLMQPSPKEGLGVIGQLPEAMPLANFLERTSTRLKAGSLRYVGNASRSVREVAVCGGAGSDLIGVALRAGADAYVTADVTYHRFFEVLDSDGQPQMALIDPGHYETEAMTETLLLDWLQQRFPAVQWHRTQHRTSPIDTYVPGQPV